MQKSSLDVAASATASTRKPRQTINRRLLWSGGTIQIKIPRSASVNAYEGESRHVRFLKFRRDVPGGVINVFIRTEDERLVGTTVSALAEVWEKTYTDGNRFLYIDLHPLPELAAPTNRLFTVHEVKEAWMREPGWKVFPTAPPLQGAVIVAPADAEVHPQRSAAAEPPSDRRLDRLKKDGWAIEREDEHTVTLSKTRGGKLDTITHHRPKRR